MQKFERKSKVEGLLLAVAFITGVRLMWL